MSARELAAEEVRRLPERQAQVVLRFIRGLSRASAVAPGELLRLPASERRRILSLQAKQAERAYRSDPSLICEDTEAPLDYHAAIALCVGY